MAGMEGLGTDFNLVGTASGVAINMSGASSVTFYGTNDGTYTLTAGKTLSGSFTATPVASWAPIKDVYTDSSNGVGTGTWTQVTASLPSNAVTTATDIGIAFSVYVSEMPAGYTYIMCTKTTANDGNPSCMAIPHKLTVRRYPPNLPAVSA